MNNKDFCEILKISEPTLYNWKKEKEYLYSIVMNYKKEHFDNKGQETIEDELLKYFKNLSKIEKEFYLSDIKARILKKEIDK
ncbi:hypothetical protein [uncultured Campylobacter sp.]|uniref:hypothetical protein n=1 Tax=uncultured Campylobacter sp. TaxID=218934 RepID=UPI002619989A|nr:hypothetical protein [uncultured Campylobacter sp.]